MKCTICFRSETLRGIKFTSALEPEVDLSVFINPSAPMVMPLPASCGAGGSIGAGGSSAEDTSSDHLHDHEEDIHESEDDKPTFSHWLRGLHSLEEEVQDKPLVHKVEDMLKYTFGSESAWCDTRAHYTATDIVKMVAHDLGVTTPMEFGKRGRAASGAPAGEGERVEKDAKIRALRADILTNMVMSQGTRNIVSHNVRTRIMELERDFQRLEAGAIFQHLYTGMTEQQMLLLQERYVAAGRNMKDRYLAISKSIFEQQYQQIEECRSELDKMTKMLNDTSNLATLMQYCSDDGFLNWADFSKTLNKTVTEKSRLVGAAAAAAHNADAGAAGANNVGFRAEEL